LFTAIDIAILPPADVSARAIALSAALPADESQGLLLGVDRLPHITLTQQFVPSESLDPLLAQLDRLLRNREPVRLRVTGGGKGTSGPYVLTEFESQQAVDRGSSAATPERPAVIAEGHTMSSVWMTIERTPVLADLHAQLLQAVEPFEVTTGDASAFFGEDARDRDVRWVREFRRESSFDRFTPHITLGHASEPPMVEPMEFVATAIAVCHLGRFCTCRHIFRAWDVLTG
jgi:2'-5' RNA ligase